MKHDPEESLGRWIFILDRCASRFVRRNLSSYGIGKGHLFFLGSLMHEGDDVSQETLADRLHMERGATARSLDTLEKQGYLRRRVDPSDARVRRISLTAKAKRLWPRIVEDDLAWNETLTRGLLAKERKQVSMVLRKMASNAMESLERDYAKAAKSNRLKKLMTLTLLLIPLAWAVAKPTFAQTPARAAEEASIPSTMGVLEVAQVLRLAAEHSLAAQLARGDSLGAEAGIREAKASWWPSITADATYTVRDNPVFAIFGDLSFPFAEKNNAAYTVQLKQTLFNGGQRSLAVSTAKKNAESVRAAGWSGIRHAQLRALSTYLQILRLNGQAGVLRQRHAALSAHRKVVEDLYEQGLVARNDLLETRVREREIQDAQLALKDARSSAVRDLNRLLGREVDTPAAFPDSLGTSPALLGSLGDFLAQADTLNPGLRAARARLEALRTSTRLARRAYWPEVYLAAGHSYEENRYLAYPHVNAVVAGVSWNIFEGGARKAKIQKAQARSTNAEKTYEDARRTVRVAVDEAWRQWHRSLREQETARANVKSAQLNLRIVEDQYRSGLARSSDVLDAEALLADSRFAVVTQHYASYWNQAQLLARAGRDPATFYANVARRGEN